jgi:glycosyltransferase involved in cell wall biosynthesis
MKKAIYGTVFNNVATVESAVRSVFRSNYDIIIVDSCSTDGTFERLRQLRQDYNLTVYRLKCTRGGGRDYALRHSPDGSMTAYVDLDAEYNEIFHVLLEQENDRVVTCAGQWTYYLRKDEALRSGGWIDLNTSEDIEFFLRNGIGAAVPAVVGRNQASHTRERRYAKGRTRAYVRMLAKTVDRIRGDGMFVSEVTPRRIGLESRRLKESSASARLFCKALYLTARVRGMKKRYDRALPNRETLLKEVIGRLVDPADFGIGDEYSVLPLSLPAGWVPPDSAVKRSWNHGYIYECPGGNRLGFRPVVYAKSAEALDLVLRSGSGIGCDAPALRERFGFP